MNKKEQIFTIPNILSFFRIALIPFIIWMYFIEMYYLCAGLIVLSALTDVADGYIARHFNMVSALGKALDPIADKLTLLAILICVGLRKKVLFILAGLFVIKEFLMGLQGLMVIKKTGTTYSAKWYGKVTTAVMYLSMLIIIMWEQIPMFAIYIILGLCSTLVIFSLIMYTKNNWQYLIKKPQ